MNYQHIENLLIRLRGRMVDVKAVSGSSYSGLISEVTNDYVALKAENGNADQDVVIVLLHSIESVRPQAK
jgi:hypothetical protein